MSGATSLETLSGGTVFAAVYLWLPGAGSASRVLIPAAGAEANVYVAGTTDPVPVYETPALTGAPLVQPLVADADGRLPGYVAQPEALDVALSGAGLAPRTVRCGIDPAVLALTDVHVVASDAAMLAIPGAHEGSVAIRTDVENRVFMNNGGTTGTDADWTQIGFGNVLSVNGNSGDVTLHLNDLVATADVDLAGHELTGVGDATADTHAVNRRSGDTRYERLSPNRVAIEGAGVDDSTTWQGLMADLDAVHGTLVMRPGPFGEMIALDECDWLGTNVSLRWEGGTIQQKAGARWALRTANAIGVPAAAAVLRPEADRIEIDQNGQPGWGYLGEGAWDESFDIRVFNVPQAGEVYYNDQAPGNISTLSAALNPAGGPIATLPIAGAFAARMRSGSTVTVSTAGHSQTWVLNGRANPGDASIPVVSQTPNFAYPIGSLLTGEQAYRTAGVATKGVLGLEGAYYGTMRAYVTGSAHPLLVGLSGDWNKLTAYAQFAVVRSSDRRVWVALVANTGIDPLLDDGTHWIEGTFALGKVYNAGQAVLAPIWFGTSGRLNVFVCQVNGTTGVDPKNDDGSLWLPGSNGVLFTSTNNQSAQKANFNSGYSLRTSSVAVGVSILNAGDVVIKEAEVSSCTVGAYDASTRALIEKLYMESCGVGLLLDSGSLDAEISSIASKVGTTHDFVTRVARNFNWDRPSGKIGYERYERLLIPDGVVVPVVESAHIVETQNSAPTNIYGFVGRAGNIDGNLRLILHAGDANTTLIDYSNLAPGGTAGQMLTANLLKDNGVTFDTAHPWLTVGRLVEIDLSTGALRTWITSIVNSHEVGIYDPAGVLESGLTWRIGSALKLDGAVNRTLAAGDHVEFVSAGDDGDKFWYELKPRGGTSGPVVRAADPSLRYQKITTSTTFTVPAHVTKLRIRVKSPGGGGGGAGSSATASLQAGAGGGAGGNIVEQEFDVNPGDVITITIGAGGTAGTGGAAGGNAGGAGGRGGTTTVVNTTTGVTLVSLDGGTGGGNSIANSTVAGLGVLMGVANGGFRLGAVANLSGGSGGPGSQPSALPLINSVGGGGGGAASATNGGGGGGGQQDGVALASQAAGGNGASGTTSGAAGQTATKAGCGGGGGGGGNNNTGAGGAGGVGGAGQVDIWW